MPYVLIPMSVSCRPNPDPYPFLQMSNPVGSSSRPKTRSHVVSKLSDFVGKGKEFEQREVPTLRAVMQRGILMKQQIMIEEDTAKYHIDKGDIAGALVPLVLAQWYKQNDPRGRRALKPQ